MEGNNSIVKAAKRTETKTDKSPNKLDGKAVLEVESTKKILRVRSVFTNATIFIIVPTRGTKWKTKL